MTVAITVLGTLVILFVCGLVRSCTFFEKVTMISVVVVAARAHRNREKPRATLIYTEDFFLAVLITALVSAAGALVAL
jgi:hypothetical protein